MTRRGAPVDVAIFTALTVALAVVGYLLLWTTFMVHDDEGYILYSLRTFCAKGHLYREVYTQYGPCYYLLGAAAHWLGLPFTNTSARWIALTYWLGTAVCCGLLVRKTSTSRTAGVLAAIAAFAHLWQTTSEPSHPGGLIALLVAVAAWCGARETWTRVTWSSIGAIAMALLLTKINVGVFFVASVAAYVGLRSRAIGRLTVVVTILALAALPVALMARLSNFAWVQIFILVTATAAATVVISASNLANRPMPGLTWAGIGAAVVGTVTIGFIFATGTTPAELLNGVLLAPLRQPSVYSFPVGWRWGTLPLAAVSLALACARPQAWPRWAPAAIAIARIGFVVGVVACLGGLCTVQSSAFVLCFGCTTAWLFVLRANDGTIDPTRLWLALLLVVQALHAYPVAGTQESWGTFLWMPLAALGLADVAFLVRTRFARDVVRAASLIVGVLLLGLYGHAGWRRFTSSQPFGATGAEQLRPPDPFSTACRVIIRNVAVHGTTLFSVPGMLSFHPWSGVPPPTTVNATHWFTLLTKDDQEAIRERLDRDPRSVLVVQRRAIDFLGAAKIDVSPLARWLWTHYERSFGVDGYEFWVKRGRRIMPIDTAQFLVQHRPGKPQYLITAVIAPARGISIASVTVCTLDESGNRARAVFAGPGAVLGTQEVDGAGLPRSAASGASFPVRVAGITRFTLLTAAWPDDIDLKSAALEFRDSTGNVVEVARFTD